MWKNGFMVSLVLAVAYYANAQVKSFISVSDNQDFDKVKLSLNATDGQCYIESGSELSLMNIGSASEDITAPQYEEKIIERTKQINVNLDDEHSKSLSSTISKRMFSRQSVDDYTWKVFLSNYKPLDLDLNYAVGDTYIDLSELSVERLKMHTGSANVSVNYKDGQGNKVRMDTFMIKVDMGTFNAKNLHLSRSGHVIADVGFGSMHMDFEDAVDISTDVTASVGAGRLEVILPSSDIPVKININDSPLCRIKMPAEFRQSEGSVFVNSELKNSDENYLTFNVDVAVGNIVFKSSRK
jgi:hypothetical protein